MARGLNEKVIYPIRKEYAEYDSQRAEDYFEMIANDLKKDDKDASLFIKRSDKQVEAVVVYANDKTKANEKGFGIFNKKEL